MGSKVGRPKTGNKTKVVSVSIDVDVLAAVSAIRTHTHGRFSPSDVINELMLEYMLEHIKDPKIEYMVHNIENTNNDRKIDPT